MKTEKLSHRSLSGVVAKVAPATLMVQAFSFVSSVALASVLGATYRTDAYYLALSVPMLAAITAPEEHRLALEYGAAAVVSASSEPAVILPVQVRQDCARSAPPAWTGALIDADVVRSIGYPRTELFFWAEDTEYFHRARMAGFPRVRVDEALVLHHTAARPRGSERTWRLYYQVRNTVHVRLGYRGPIWRRLWKLAPVVIGKPLAIVAFEPRKLRALGLWWRGLTDGVAGRLGRVVEPVESPG